MNTLKLIGWELERSRKMYMLLMGTLLTIQFGWLGFFLWHKTSMYEEYRREGIEMTLYFSNYLWSSIYIFSLGLGTIAMILFSLWIWYREFWGRGTFMMRLLTLSTGRIQVFVSKFITVMLMILGLISIQWLALIIEYRLFTTWLEGQGMTISETFVDVRKFEVFRWLYPSSPLNFMIHVMLIALVVLVLFAFVLVERSLWQRTLWSPLVSGSLIIGVIAVPLLVIYLSARYLFPDEFVVMLVVSFLATALTFMIIVHHFLQKKLSV